MERPVAVGAFIAIAGFAALLVSAFALIRGHLGWATIKNRATALAALGASVAVMIVGGNIDGVTRVMTTTIALETSKGDLPLAMALGLVLLAVVLVLNLLVAMVRRWRERLDGSVADTAPAWRGVQA